jgi:hypothetical protein
MGVPMRGPVAQHWPQHPTPQGALPQMPQSPAQVSPLSSLWKPMIRFLFSFAFFLSSFLHLCIDFASGSCRSRVFIGE